MKRTLLITTIIISLVVFTCFMLLRRTYTVCPKFNNSYAEWMPYNEKDVLIFTNGKEEKNFTVEKIDISHTNSYFNNTKCGCCEDIVTYTLLSNNKVIRIEIENYKNPESCLGFAFSVEFDEERYNYYGKDITDKDSIISLENKLYLSKNNGIIKIDDNNSLWQLKEVKHSSEKKSIHNTNGC